jgi:hypothetical protein
VNQDQRRSENETDTSVHHLACINAGGCQLPWPDGRIDGGVSFGQYRRITMEIGPTGAGSQLASLPLPGASFWI